MDSLSHNPFKGSRPPSLSHNLEALCTKEDVGSLAAANVLDMPSGGQSGKTLRDTKRSPPSNVQQKRRGRTHHLGVDRTDLIRSANGTRRKPLDSNAAVAQVKSFCGREVYFLLFGPAMAREQ